MNIAHRRRDWIRPIPLKLLLLIASALLWLIVIKLPQPAPALRVATNIWPGYESLYLARALGYYPAEAIRLVEMTSASQVSHALRNGTVEAAALTLDETLSLLQYADIKLKVILILDISNGADVLLARPDITDLKMLKNRRIGVENSATGAVLLDGALDSSGLDTGDVTIIPLTANKHLNAWQHHDIDALVTFEPLRSELLNQGAQALFDSTQIPGRIVDVLVVRSDAVQTQSAHLKSLIAGHFRAIQYFTEHTQQAAALMAPRLAPRDTQKVLGQFEGLKLPGLVENWLWLSGPNAILNESSSALTDRMVQHQLLQVRVNADSLADPAFLPEPAR